VHTQVDAHPHKCAHTHKTHTIHTKQNSHKTKLTQNKTHTKHTHRWSHVLTYCTAIIITTLAAESYVVFVGAAAPDDKVAAVLGPVA